MNEIPDDLLDLMSEWALHDPDPEQESWRIPAGSGQPYYGGDPHGHGINTNRGAAVRTVCRCAFKRTSPQFERVFILLEQISENDPSTAVRACVLEVLGPLLNQDAERTLEIFEHTIDDHPVLLQSPLAHRFLSWVYREHFDRVRPYIETLLVHSDDSTRQAGARLACLAAFFHPEAIELAKQALNGDEIMRQGAARIYARNLENEEFSDTCQEHLLILMQDPDEEVRKDVGECFMYLRSEHLDQLRPFIIEFLYSPALLLGAEYLIEYLNPLATEEYELPLLATELILDAGGDAIVDMRRSLAIIERDLVKLPLTVYTHSLDPEQQERAMQLFERLLLLGSRSAQQALSEWDGKKYPILSITRHNLSLSEEEQEELSIKKVIQKNKKLLEVISKSVDQKKRIESHIILANAYRKYSKGDRAENLERAINHYQQALEEITPTQNPIDWTKAQTNLATAYRERLKGDRSQNIEQAINLYQEALSVLDRETNLGDWAAIQANLATAFRERIKGDRAENLEKAINHYQQALEEITPTQNPIDWTKAQTNLATAYRERLKGDRSQNIEQAINLYQEALSVLDRETNPGDWAAIQANLATAFRERIKGERAKNIERSIDFYLQVLEIFTRETHPFEWAANQTNLAEAYRERIRGNRVDNIELAIECYRQALEVRSSEQFPIEWAETNFNLASAYLEHTQGEREENIELAINLYQQILQVYTREALPQQWAITQINLAAAYRERIRGNRINNLGDAVSHLQQATEVYTQEAFPEQWASTINNLATTYQDLIHTDEGAEERAIRNYQRALEVYSREVYPEQWAAIQVNLANIYLSRKVGDRIENLQQTVHHFERALEIYNREVSRERQATITRQLESTQQELTLTEFFQLWTRAKLSDKDERISQFSNLFSKLINCPLRRDPQNLPEIEGYLAIYDMSSLFEKNRLPFSEEFPVLFLAINSLNENYRENIRKLLEKWIGPSNRRALLIPFCEAEELVSVRDFCKGTIKQVHAYDLICLSQGEVEHITRSEEPEITFHRIIISKIDLVSVNPYKQTGATSVKMFFGRERELQAICDQATSTNFVLIGGRRIGKTSMLKQLEKVRLPSAEFNAYYHSCDETPTQTEMVQALTMNKFWFPERPRKAPSTLAEVIRCLPYDKPIVILFDEVDKLIRPEQFDDHSIFDILRALSNSDRCRFILCGERLLREELTNPDSPLYNFGIPMPIGRLDFHAVKELVTRPMKRLELKIVDEESFVQHIWDFTSGHPSIIQSLCRKIVEYVNERQPRLITPDDLETVVNDRDFLEKDFLNVYWERATALERLCSMLMVANDSTRSLIAVHQTLTRYEINAALNQVNDALGRLVDLRNILQRTSKGYEFAVTAFPEVIAKTARLNDLIALNREIYQEHGDVEPRSRRGVT